MEGQPVISSASRGRPGRTERLDAGRAVARTFATRVAHLHDELARDGIPFADMRRAETLELQLAGVPDLGRATGATRVADIERLEGPIVARPVPSLPPSASRLRYFLDGAQRTFQVWRFGLIPVTATIAAAAILVRDRAGNPTVAPGTLRLEHALLVPRRADAPEVAGLVRAAESSGMRIVDPLDEIKDEQVRAAIAEDYGRMVECAYVCARKLRERVETTLLVNWVNAPARADDEGWLVVDGRLRVAAPRALGLVKQFGERHLAGTEAEALLGLLPGHRTTAFRPRDEYWDIADPRDENAIARRNQLALWYLRLWNAAGLDARHALVRIEACLDPVESPRIDELSAWLMAERTPRATADARWATLLYPVHYLERILKRRLEADTYGWPGG